MKTILSKNGVSGKVGVVQGAGVVADDADVVQAPAVAQGDYAVIVDAVALDAVVAVVAAGAWGASRQCVAALGRSPARRQARVRGRCWL